MGPLDGVRVVEIASLAPAPFGCMVLSDLGADVLRVERPESCRAGLPAPVDPLTRGRRSIGLNLKDPAGLDLLLQAHRRGRRAGRGVQAGRDRAARVRAARSARSATPGWSTPG